MNNFTQNSKLYTNNNKYHENSTIPKLIKNIVLNN